MRYTGPLRDEPLAVELHNTIYATSAGPVDAFDDPDTALAWLEALAARLEAAAPGAGSWPGPLARPWPSLEELRGLRGAVRAALRAAADGAAIERASLDAINAASRLAPRAPVAVWRDAGHPARATDYGNATGADIVLATFAADAIDLLTGDRRHDLRTCGAPRCVLMFVSDHPRREWCSDRCGNRARQARHYERHSGRR